MSTTVHTRAAGAEVLDVDFTDRIVSVIVAPYEQPALVEYRGEIWEERIAYGAFNTVDDIDPQTIRVNREHSRADAIGKCVAFDARDPRGLIATIRIARTARGDDTLGLAAEGMLSASAGFAIDPSSGQILDRTSSAASPTHTSIMLRWSRHRRTTAPACSPCAAPHPTSTGISPTRSSRGLSTAPTP